jgi:hypothetical protein
VCVGVPFICPFSCHFLYFLLFHGIGTGGWQREACNEPPSRGQRRGKGQNVRRHSLDRLHASMKKQKKNNRRRSVAQSVGHAVKHAVAERNKPNNELSQAGNCEKHEQSIMQAVAQAIPPTGHQSEYRSGCRAEYRTETLMIIRCEHCLQAVNIAANIDRRGWLLTLM